MGVSESGAVCFLLYTRAAVRPVPRLGGHWRPMKGRMAVYVARNINCLMLRGTLCCV